MTAAKVGNYKHNLICMFYYYIRNLFEIQLMLEMIN